MNAFSDTAHARQVLQIYGCDTFTVGTATIDAEPYLDDAALRQVDMMVMAVCVQARTKAERAYTAWLVDRAAALASLATQVRPLLATIDRQVWPRVVELVDRAALASYADSPAGGSTFAAWLESLGGEENHATE